MIKIVFIAILVVHGLIHLIGFVNAFKLANVNQTKNISKLIGLLWLFTALLFIITALIYLNKEYWWIIAIPSIVFSQILIINSWQDAKFGTIANIIIVIACIIGYGEWKFDKDVSMEVKSLISVNKVDTDIISKNTISNLPNIVQSWLRYSNVIGKNKVSTVHLYQSGQMKAEQNGNWLSFNAEQWFTTDKPGFIWNADVGLGSLMSFSGRDKYLNGKGNMLISLYSLFPVVDAKGYKINQGVAIRYLAEIVWFPTAALSSFISWKQISQYTAEAFLSYGGITVSGRFTFNGKGQVISFEANRYYDKTGEKEIWFINIDKNSYKSFENIIIPTKATVTWKLNSGDFTWLKLKIEKIEYN